MEINFSIRKIIIFMLNVEFMANWNVIGFSKMQLYVVSTQIGFNSKALIIWSQTFFCFFFRMYLFCCIATYDNRKCFAIISFLMKVLQISWQSQACRVKSVFRILYPDFRSFFLFLFFGWIKKSTTIPQHYIYTKSCLVNFFHHVLFLLF